MSVKHIQDQEQNNVFEEFLSTKDKQQEEELKQRQTMPKYREGFDRADIEWGDSWADSAKLGEKVSKAKTEAEIERNRNIDEAKKLTKKATAYTLEVHDILNSDLLRKDTDPAHMLSAIESFHFTSNMMRSSNIRAHFAEYATLVRYWDALNSYIQEHNDPVIRDRMESLSPIMKMFRKRISKYARSNRVKLDGTVVDDDKVEVSRTSKSFLNKWEELVGEQNREIYDPAAEAAAIDQETLNRVLDKEQEPEKIRELKDMTPFVLMRTEERVRNLPGIRQFVELLKDRRDTMQTVCDTLQQQLENSEEKDKTEISRKLKYAREEFQTAEQSLFEAKCSAKIAEAEARYLLAKKQGEDTEDMKSSLDSLYSDYRLIKERLFKSQFSSISFRTTSNEENAAVTVFDARNGYSDLKNKAFKSDLLEACREMKQKISDGIPSGDNVALNDAVEKVALYCSANHYNQTPEEEGRILKDAVESLKNLEKDFPGNESLNKVMNKLIGMRDGSLDVKNWDDIPDQFKKDCRNRNPNDAFFSRGTGGYKNFFTNNWFTRTYQDRRNEPLFAHEPTVNDIRQTKVCNCWMIAATSTLINMDPNIIKNAIKDNGDGTCTVRLFQEDQDTKFVSPVYLRVDKVIPKMRTGGDLLSSGALWMQMLERALAFLGTGGKRGYKSLWYGDGQNWVFALTGKKSEFITTLANDGSISDIVPGENEEERQANLFDQICRCREEGKVFTSGTKSKVDSGLYPDHAYSILGGKIEGGQRYVLLRNPYANMSLRYDSRGRQSRQGGTFGIMQSAADETNGNFSIKYEDFLRNFGRIYRADLKQEEPETDFEKLTEKLNNVKQQFEQDRDMLNKEIENKEDDF